MNIEICQNVGGARTFVALDGTIQVMGPKAAGKPWEEIARISFTHLPACIEFLQQVAWCADYIARERDK